MLRDWSILSLASPLQTRKTKTRNWDQLKTLLESCRPFSKQKKCFYDVGNLCWLSLSIEIPVSWANSNRYVGLAKGLETADISD